MASVLSRVLIRFRRVGIGRTLKYIVFVVFLERCGVQINDQYILDLTSVDSEPAKIDGFAPETLTQLEQLSEADLEFLRAYGEAEAFGHRFARGQTCLIMRTDNGELAGACWYGPQEADGHRGGMIDHCFTRHEYRGKGLYPWALRYIASATTRQGTDAFSTLHIECSAFNYSSAAGIRKAGFVLTETAITFGKRTLLKSSQNVPPSSGFRRFRQPLSLTSLATVKIQTTQYFRLSQKRRLTARPGMAGSDLKTTVHPDSAID